MRTFVFISVLAALASSACASSDFDEAALPHANRVAGKDSNQSYVQFASFADAKNFVETTATAESPRILEQGDARYATVGPMFDRVWDVYSELYADDLRGVPKPLLLVSAAKETNAFALRYDTEHVAGLFVVNVGLLDALARDEVQVVVAHELGHYVLGHMLMGGDILEKSYRSDGVHEPLGFEATDDAAAKVSIELFTTYVDKFGSARSPSLRALPLGSAGHAASKALDDAADSTGAGACLNAKATLAGIVESFGAWFDTYAEDIEANAPALVATTVENFQRDFVACGAAAKIAPLDAHGRPGVNISGAWRRTDTTNGFEAALRETEEQRERMRHADVTSARQYTREEQADDAAMIVTHRLGLPPDTLGNAMLRLSTFIGASADYEPRCRADLAAGKVPPYWAWDPHHSPCYRAYHGHAFAARVFR